MKVLVFIVLFAIVVLAGVIVGVALVRRRPVPPPSDANSVEYRNHQRMARLLDHLVHDDYVSGVIPAQTKRDIREALADYYDNPAISKELD